MPSGNGGAGVGSVEVIENDSDIMSRCQWSGRAGCDSACESKLDGADLHDVIDRKSLLLTGEDPTPIHESAVEAVQIFDRNQTIPKSDHRMMARRPDAIGRFQIR